MTNFGKRPGLSTAVGVAVCLFLTPFVHGQATPTPVVPANNNPYPVVGLNPAAQNAAAMGRVGTPAPLVGANPIGSGLFPLNGGQSSFTSVPNTTPPYNPNTALKYSTVYPGYDPWGGTYSPGGGYGGGGYGGYPYGGYNPYMPYVDPFSGFMRGTADIISAAGSYAVRVQESRMIGQQVAQARVDTRRKIYDQWLYERATMPTNQDERERYQRYELRRALTDPQPTEILSAIPINRIYKDLRDKVAAGAKGQAVVIDEGTLQKINVTAPGAGNIGVLNPLVDGGTMNWPALLRSDLYQDEVKIINTRCAEAVKQVIHKGEVDSSRLAEITAAINTLKKKLDDNVTELTPAQWIEAKRFLSHLEAAQRALNNPNITAYLTDKFSAKGKTVPELVKYMSQKGLEFAPAVTGDEAGYMALYNYLLAYSNSIGGPGSTRDE